LKSHEKSYYLLCEAILLDGLALCSANEVDVVRDLVTIKSRAEGEGLSFYTITLPNFAQGIERSLEHGQVTHADFQGWKFCKCLPAFLRGFTSLIFDVATGRTLVDPDVDALKVVRQLSYAFKKILLPCKPEKVQKAIDGYLQVERYLSEPKQIEDIEIFSKISDVLWGEIFYDFNVMDTIPKHGPGATEERIYHNRKYVHRIWHDRLQACFPIDHYGMVNINQLDDGQYGLDSISFSSLEDERPVRVVTVPKTLKGPRVIAIEPVCMQYTQQALSSFIIERIKSSDLTGGHVNFTDQTINKRLAISASKRKHLACLDLSEASDRVPLSLVKLMLKSSEHLLDCLLACRSLAAQLPTGQIVDLKKFASMGSAVTFPIEAMYFLTVILTSLVKGRGCLVTRRNLKKLMRQVYVYGDDLFVPVGEAEAVCETLAQFYCKVNVHKSFLKSNFRESCGMDAFNGYDITPVYIRRVLPTNRAEAQELISTISTSNQFYLKGYWRTSVYLMDEVEKVIGKLPIVGETSSGLGWLSRQFTFDKGKPLSRVNLQRGVPIRINPNLHKYEYLTWSIKVVKRKDPLTSWPALLKCLLFMERRKGNDAQSVSSDHLERSPRSGTVSIKRQWAPFC